MNHVRYIFTILLLYAARLGAAIPYHVEFFGADGESACLLHSVSRLVALEETPPVTDAALKKRINDDVPNLLKALQSLGYYSSTIHVALDHTIFPVQICLSIDTGPLYAFTSFEIYAAEDSCTPFPYESICADELGILMGAVALPANIHAAEETLIEQLEQSGYPLAKLTKREVIADQTARTITVVFHVDCGPLAFFGQTNLCGNKETLPAFFCRKIAWNYGGLYDPCKIKRTFDALELSGLFSTINVEHGEELDEDGTLPMVITVKEAKPRTIAFGVGYATDLGGGVNFEWQHRNVRSVGERLSVVANLWQIKQEGYIKYILPDFLRPRQDLIWTLEAEHEEVAGFREMSYSFSGIIERQLTDRLRISFGGMFTRLRNTHSNDDGNFNLLKAPWQIYWNGANSLLDPTRGGTLHFKMAPTLQTLRPCFAYAIQTLTATGYYPIDSEDRFVFAVKATLGSIWGANKRTIPPSERFYAGSDTLLRGYHYLTVSPLNAKHKPIGGRSVMVYSFEMRMRVRDPFGCVLFYDVGNVYGQSLPQINHKQLQAAGLGLRYHTPVGPIRLDIAFPLNPRPHVDKAVQVYFSIGQSF